MNIHPDYPAVEGIRCDFLGKAYLLVLAGQGHPPVGCLVSADLGFNEATDISDQFEVEVGRMSGLALPLKIGAAYTLGTPHGRVVAMRATVYSGENDSETWIGLDDANRGRVIEDGVPEAEFSRAALVSI